MVQVLFNESRQESPLFLLYITHDIGIVFLSVIVITSFSVYNVCVAKKIFFVMIQFVNGRGSVMIELN